MMTEQHTIEQLQAMSDSELAELAARLRGWGNLYAEIMAGSGWKSGKDWNPAADDTQALGLLRWAKEQGKVGFNIRIGRPADELECFINGYWRFSLPGNDARAMTIAFVLAMQEAMQ